MPAHEPIAAPAVVSVAEPHAPEIDVGAPPAVHFRERLAGLERQWHGRDSDADRRSMEEYRKRYCEAVTLHGAHGSCPPTDWVRDRLFSNRAYGIGIAAWAEFKSYQAFLAKGLGLDPRAAVEADSRDLAIPSARARLGFLRGRRDTEGYEAAKRDMGNLERSAERAVKDRTKDLLELSATRGYLAETVYEETVAAGYQPPGVRLGPGLLAPPRHVPLLVEPEDQPTAPEQVFGPDGRPKGVE
ncbi:MAG: hypothetical protein ACYCWW_12960 [Deltaproteobacteria bacterium]